TAAEREVGQTMVFDVDLSLTDCGATETDELDGTTDYGAVTGYLVEIATEQSYMTLEHLTAVIAERFMERFNVSLVRIRAAKPDPPVPTVMEEAAVELILQLEPGPGNQ
ncbi:MAG: dihydroneopterin aldolase, partial [Solirubrobacterales bacterium]